MAVTCPQLRTGEGRCQAWPSVALVVALGVWGQAGWALPLASLLWWKDRRLEMEAAVPPPNLSPSVARRQGTDRPDWQMTQEKQQNSNSLHL